jgi:C-methyltransferase C-terminal domain/Methyltransferase domain/Putative zinc binding domain
VLHGGRIVMRCGLCASRQLEPLLDLGEQPLAERMGDGPRFPLSLQECRNCSLVQLGYIPEQDEVFPPDHPYTTGATRALRDHFAGLARLVSERLEPGDVVVDIGANDGTLLGYMPSGVRCVAVEPTGQAAKCRARGFRTWQAGFTADVAAGIEQSMGGKAKLVTATNVMSHVHDPHDVMTGVAGLLDPGGVFVAENHDVASVLGGLQIDTVYHEHAWYWSPATFGMLVSMHGLDVTATGPTGTHGGSFRVIARPRRRDFAQRARAALDGLHDLAAACGGGVYGIGATTRASTLIHAARLQDLVACVCEIEGSEKIGTTMPGTAIPVVAEQKLIDDQPAFALLFAWHLRYDLVPKLEQLGYRGEFIIPLPVPHVHGRAAAMAGGGGG